MTWAPEVLTGVLASILAASVFGYGTRIALWISQHAARLLPANQRDRYRKEWGADILTKSRGPIDGRDGAHHLAAFLWGAGTIWTALRCSNARRRLTGWLLSDDVALPAAMLIIGYLPYFLVFWAFGWTANAVWITGALAALFFRMVKRHVVSVIAACVVVTVAFILIDGIAHGVTIGMLSLLCFGVLTATPLLVDRYGPSLLAAIRSQFPVLKNE